jgi:hypothetical protein
MAPAVPARGGAVDAAQASGAGDALTAAVLFGAFVLKLVDFIKSAAAGDRNGLATIVIGWAAGIVAVFVFTLTQWADEVRIGDETLQDLTGPSKIVLGLVATSVAAYFYDVKKALDRTDTASTPRLLAADEKERKRRVESYFAAREQLAPAPSGRDRG